MLHPLLDALRTPSTPKNIVQRITYLGKLAELRIMDVKSDYTLRKTAVQKVFEQMPIAIFGERGGGADPYLKGPPECTRGQPKCTSGQSECAIRGSTTCARATRWPDQPEREPQALQHTHALRGCWVNRSARAAGTKKRRTRMRRFHAVLKRTANASHYFSMSTGHSALRKTA